MNRDDLDFNDVRQRAVIIAFLEYCVAVREESLAYAQDELADYLAKPMGEEMSLQRSLARRRKSEAWPWGYGLTPEKVEALKSVGNDPGVKVRVALDTLCRESVNYLATLERDVRECKSVVEANNFTRWLQFAGVLTLLEMFPDVNPDCLLLRRRARELTMACGEHFKGGRVDAKYGAGDIAEINRKLDVLMSQSAKPVHVDSVVPVERLLLSEPRPVTVDTGSGGFLAPRGSVEALGTEDFDQSEHAQ